MFIEQHTTVFTFWGIFAINLKRKTNMDEKKIKPTVPKFIPVCS